MRLSNLWWMWIMFSISSERNEGSSSQQYESGVKRVSTLLSQPTKDEGRFAFDVQKCKIWCHPSPDWLDCGWRHARSKHPNRADNKKHCFKHISFDFFQPKSTPLVKSNNKLFLDAHQWYLLVLHIDFKHYSQQIIIDCKQIFGFWVFSIFWNSIQWAQNQYDITKK